MMKAVIGAALVSLFAAGPALAVGANCHDQLAQIKAQIDQKSGAKKALNDKYIDAERLCSQNKDEEAQAMARQLREELAGKEGAGSSMSGSSTGAAPHR